MLQTKYVQITGAFDGSLHASGVGAGCWINLYHDGTTYMLFHCYWSLGDTSIAVAESVACLLLFTILNSLVSHLPIKRHFGGIHPHAVRILKIRCTIVVTSVLDVGPLLFLHKVVS